MTDCASPRTRPPTAERCRRILERHGVPEHIQRHSEQVARVVRALADHLGRAAAGPLDAELLVAAALLHDVAKADCFDSGKDHAREGGRLLRQMGMDAVAALVERHVELGGWNPEGPVTEAEVLNYGDKRVRHDEVVSLDERFRDLLERYGTRYPEARGRILANWRFSKELEKKIFARLPVGPDFLGR
ncbi:MAG: HDIG domain-containing protein [Deferrisomatales bacterium]